MNTCILCGEPVETDDKDARIIEQNIYDGLQGSNTVEPGWIVKQRRGKTVMAHAICHLPQEVTKRLRKR